MGYDKSETAKQLGISKKELEKRAKSAGYKKTGDYVAANGGVAGLLYKELKDKVTKDIIEIDRQLDELFVIGLTQEEKDQFLQRAIDEVQPYYDNKKAELEKGLQEGTIRTAEDALTTIREVEQELASKLQYYDLQTAQTEEEFINRLADITATKDEDVKVKAMDWRDRIETIKLQQVQSGNFMAGEEIRRRKDLEERKQLELGSIERKAQVAQQTEEINKKYTLESVRLARESAQQARTRQIGAPVETEETKTAALSSLGLSDMGQLGSEAELLRKRTERGVVPVYDRNVLTDLERSRLSDVESTKQELEKQRIAENTAAYEKQRQKLLADKAAKAAQLGTYAI